MRILSIGKEIAHKEIVIDSVPLSSLSELHDIDRYDYIIISGGDGTIRRTLTELYDPEKQPIFILNPAGSFNVVAKMHKVPPVEKVLDMLAQGGVPKTQKHRLFRLNGELFLFSAGNMGDLQHIFLSETLRFGWLKHGITKYILAAIFLFPVHLLMTPFMLMSKTRFFIFTPLRIIKKLGSFYGKIPEELIIDLENGYNMLELDGDIVIVHERRVHIRHAGDIKVVTR